MVKSSKGHALSLGTPDPIFAYLHSFLSALSCLKSFSNPRNVLDDPLRHLRALENMLTNLAPTDRGLASPPAKHLVRLHPKARVRLLLYENSTKDKYASSLPPRSRTRTHARSISSNAWKVHSPCPSAYGWKAVLTRSLVLKSPSLKHNNYYCELLDISQMTYFERHFQTNTNPFTSYATPKLSLTCDIKASP